MSCISFVTRPDKRNDPHGGQPGRPIVGETRMRRVPDLFNRVGSVAAGAEAADIIAVSELANPAAAAIPVAGINRASIGAACQRCIEQ